MQSTSTPYEQAADLLRELPILRVKLARALFCPPATCETALAEVIKFLTLAADCTDGHMTPSARVDLAWHEFILFTRVYSKFCEQNFGKMIHHEPSEDQHKNSRQYTDTLCSYRKNFGEPPREYWAPDKHSKVCQDDTGELDTNGRTAHCGSCESDS